MLALAITHILSHHRGANGLVTIGKKEKGKWQQRHYTIEQAEKKLAEWIGEDVYFSQNTFFKPERTVENVRQLRAVFADLDFYLFNLDPAWVLGNVDLMVKDGIIPEPNMIIFSGRGIVPVWLIEPVPYKALPLWQAVENHFVKQFEKYGADSKASDAARVFRLAGTINSKSGEMVQVEYRHLNRYVLRDLQREYLPELNEPKKGEKKRGRKSAVVHLYNVYSLHTARLWDLAKLVELRGGKITGYRETMCFLYRYWSCCVLADTDEALRQTLDFNSRFIKPLPEREVIKATKSAEKAWAARNDKAANEAAQAAGYPGAGYNLKNSTLINWLAITPEEQQELSTIIDGSEKRRRKMLANRKLRGSVSREEYMTQEKEKTEDKLYQLQLAMQKYPKAKRAELAELLGISVSRIAQLKRSLKSV